MRPLIQTSSPWPSETRGDGGILKNYLSCLILTGVFVSGATHKLYASEKVCCNMWSILWEYHEQQTAARFDRIIETTRKEFSVLPTSVQRYWVEYWLQAKETTLQQMRLIRAAQQQCSTLLLGFELSPTGSDAEDS